MICALNLMDRGGYRISLAEFLDVTLGRCQRTELADIPPLTTSCGSSPPYRAQSHNTPGRSMLKKAIVTTVDYCARYARQVIGIALFLGFSAAFTRPAGSPSMPTSTS